MAVARFVVLEGPDSGREFAIPLRGGSIGRGEENMVQLSDLSVSRTHCTVEMRDGQLALIDSESRNKTLVNGKPITSHVLVKGDEVVIGQTRLAFVPSEGTAPRISVGAQVKATMEIGSHALLAVKTSLDASSRAHRYLSSIASLGDALKVASSREQVLQSSCATSREALDAERAIINMRGSGGRLIPVAASADGPTDLDIPREVLGMVLGEGKSIAFDELKTAAGPKAVAAAPLWSPDQTPIGMLWADRPTNKPWDRTDVMAIGCLAHLISAAVQSADAQAVLTQENRELVAQIGGREFIGESKEASMVMGFVAKVGPSEATVLLTGESGSGKEMVARAIHQASRRSSKAFVAVNCAALTESLIESELFGHEKGAFTGANERKLGRFELANDGTLFLDEVGELPLGCQTKFLRVLEEQTFERVGGGKPIMVDVRVVAATNRNLGEMVRRGEFREDLYYRLSVIHNQVPPLRRRQSDIPALCEHFLAKLSRQVGRRIRGFSPDATELLKNYPWPGNVRELKNAVERAIVLGDSEYIQVHDLPPNITSGIAGPAGPRGGPPIPGSAFPGMPTPPSPFAAAPPPAAPPQAPQAPPPARSLKELEREGIIAALNSTNGNKAQAAQVLEIDRSTLYKKIKDYGIES